MKCNSFNLVSKITKIIWKINGLPLRTHKEYTVIIEQDLVQ